MQCRVQLKMKTNWQNKTKIKKGKEQEKKEKLFI